jgi:hypothetical protein
LKWWIGEFQIFTDPELLSNFVAAALNDYEILMGCGGISIP